MRDKKKIKHIAASAIFLTAFGWLLYCTVPTLYWGDSAEMTSVACSLGVAHSPGYPLFSILSRIFLWLPVHTAFAAHMMSVFCAAAALAMMFYMLCAITGQIFPAAIGAALFAGIPAFVSFSLFIEVYALHLLLFCALIYCLTRTENENDRRWFMAAVLVLAAGVSHHILMYFALAAFMIYCMLRPGHSHRTTAAPLLLFFAWSFMNLLDAHELAVDTLKWYKIGLMCAAGVFVAYIVLIGLFDRRRFPAISASTIAGLFIFAAGVGVFVYLPLTAARAPVANWWSPDTPGDFLNLLFLKGYPPTFPDTYIEAQKRADLAGLLAYVLIPIISAAAVGLLAMLFRRVRARIAIMLLLTGAFTLVGAMLVKHGKPEALRLPVYLIIDVFAAYGLAWILSWKLWRGKKWKLALVAPFYILPALYVLIPIQRADFRSMNKSGGAYELGESIIAQTAPDSILFIGEQTPSIIGYFSACEPDRLRKKRIVPVPVSFLSFDWKVDQLRDEYPGVYFPPVIKKSSKDNVFSSFGDDRIRYTLEMLKENPERRNVFSDFYFLPLDLGWYTIPQGVVYRLASSRDFAAFQIQSMFQEDRPPHWDNLDKRDILAAENIASVHNERGIVYLRYGSMLHSSKMVQKANREFDLALKINPKYAVAMSNKGACALYFGDEHKAVRLQSKAITIDNEDPQLLNAYAETLLQTHSQKGVERAVALMIASLALKPKQPTVFYNLGAAYVMLGDKDRAIMFLKTAIETSPRYIEPYRALARLYESIGQCGEAASYLEMAADKTPRDIDIRAELIKLYAHCGWKNLFNDGMRDMYRDFPHDNVFYQTVGTIYRDLGRLDYTMKVYEQAHTRDPRFKLVNLFLSLTAEDCEANLPVLGKAVSMAPDDFGLRLHYASVLCLCNRQIACETNLLEAKRIDPREKAVDLMLADLQKVKAAYPELFRAKPEDKP